jgi:hypothetical protein
MSDFVTHDLPVESAEGEEPLLIDANAGFYEAQPRGKSYVYVERYVQKKIFFEPLVEGTESSIRPETYLIKTTNYQDIGGGLVMFDRHYAQIPLAWFDYQVVGITTSFFRSLTTTLTINPRFIGGSQQNTSLLAKVTRKYYLEKDLPIDLNINAPEEKRVLTPITETVNVGGIIIVREIGFEPVDFINIIVREDDVGIYQGNIYEVATFTGTFRFTGQFDQLEPIGEEEE